MKISFGGDIFLGEQIKTVEDLNLPKAYLDSDFRILNFEQALGAFRYQSKSQVWSGPEMICHLEKFKINAVNLANNHIHDLGQDGFYETIDLLKKNKINYFGAGINEIEASTPFKINDDLYVLGYCEKNNDYLSAVKVSKDDDWGTRLLNLENIKKDLSCLPPESKAIILTHWGVEHLILPAPHIIKLTKQILSLDKVVSVIGCHPHVIQGSITFNGKKAYFSMGNFIFPNFSITPPSISGPLSNTPWKTYGYHNVYKITNKYWKRFNRVGLHVVYDSERNILRHHLHKQDRYSPVLTELKFIERIFDNFRFDLSRLIIGVPQGLYERLFSTYRFVFYKIRNTKMYIFKLKQLGLKQAIRRYRD